MAYLNFSEIAAAPAAARAPRHAAAGLTSLEWSVVALAQRDTLASLSEPGPLSIALGAVFGGRRHNPRLADPKLEALRRVSVFAWRRGYAVPPSELRAFEAAGFSEEQYEVLQASISRGRAALQRKN
ncbi:MAG: hypothetical protein WDN24_08045 [Sphingomonas sp.]